MSLEYPPAAGMLLRVDLHEGFRPPEMIKRRPCVVLNGPSADRRNLCAIIPLSTTAPTRPKDYHHQLFFESPLPAPYSSPVMWAKCDMIMSVGYHRLKLLSSGKDDEGKRVYDTRILPDETMEALRQCIRCALRL